MLGQLRLISASQITTYWKECQRKWAFKSVAKLEAPAHASALLGTEVDEGQLQPYLRDGKMFDYSKLSGYIAASALPFLPEPKTPGLVLQKHFELPSPNWKTAGFGYQGYIDLWHTDSSVMPGLEGGVPLVCDFKTTSNLKWQKNELSLQYDVQAMLYAMHALFETRTKAVDLAWVYMQTKGARTARRTHLRVVRDHVAEQFRCIDKTAIEMFAVRKDLESKKDIEAAVLALPPNKDMCDAYGGCPYRSKCNLDYAQQLEEVESIMANTPASNSIMARLKKQREAALGTSAPATAPVVVEEIKPVAEPAVVGINPPPVAASTVPAPITVSTPVEVADDKPKRGRKPKADVAESAPVAGLDPAKFAGTLSALADALADASAAIRALSAKASS